MIYNNLIYFLVVIFVVTIAVPSREPWLAPYVGLPLFGLVLFLFYLLAGRWYVHGMRGEAKAFFAAEKKLSILAVLLFCGSIFVFDLKYYLAPLSLEGALPVLENLAGLALFFLFLALIWLQARPAYQLLFNRSYTAPGFVIYNIKANLPIVLPWLALSLLFDLVLFLPFPRLQELLLSPWGDLFLFLFFVCFLALFFPPLVRKLWNCRPLEEGPLRTEMETFCRSCNFSSEILYWPLFEGRVLTAGIMGILPGLRYLLVTPALLSLLDREELESVLAHEIGHVKRFHLLLYVLLFLGFSLLVGALAVPLPYLFLGSDRFYRLLSWFHVSPESLLAFLVGFSLLLLLVFYFRFIFGYFIRNFERQADLYVFKVQGNSFPLIRSFEKIASMSGNIREQKSWHHFGIGERVDFLTLCEGDRSRIRLHDRKVYVSLAAYVVLVGLLVWSLHQVDTDRLAKGYELRYAQVVLEQKLESDPDNSLLLKLFGDLMQEKKMEQKALTAYEKALQRVPLNPELANNLAWLLLTAGDRGLRDAGRALALARSAASRDQRAHVLDTLATALWANGRIEEAVQVEKQAAEIDPDNSSFYQSQMEKFATEDWSDS